MNLSGCYNDTQKDANHYYLIGYYTDLSKGKTGWRKLEVVVPRPHVEVRARSGYYVRSKSLTRKEPNTKIWTPPSPHLPTLRLCLCWSGGQGVHKMAPRYG